MKVKSLVATTLSTCVAIATVSLSSQAQDFSGVLTNIRWGEPFADSSVNTEPVCSVCTKNIETNIETDTFTWGDKDDFGVGANKLAFKAIAFDNSAFNSPFAIAKLEYFNGTTLLGTNVDKVSLFFDFLIDGTQSLTESFKLDFNLKNTPNLSTIPAENADSVFFPNTYPLRKFTLNNREYQFALAGFSQDGGVSYLSQLDALESENAEVNLYAKIIQLPVAATPLPPTNSHTDNNGTPPKQRVPEPGMIFGISLMALYGISRFK